MDTQKTPLTPNTPAARNSEDSSLPPSVIGGAPSSITLHDLELIPVNAALLRLFQGGYRNPGDRHNDSLFVRDHLMLWHEDSAKLRVAQRTAAAHAERVAELEKLMREALGEMDWIARNGWLPMGTVGENAHLAYDCHSIAAALCPKFRQALSSPPSDTTEKK